MDSQRELEWLRRVRDFSQRMAAEPELEQLLPLILEAAVEITGAERGFLVRILSEPGGEPSLRVEVARGFDRAELESPEAEVSRTVVERVLERGSAGLVSSSGEDEDIVSVSSVRARHVLSVACVPMRVRGQPLGVLYLDHRFVPEAFAAQDLPILRTFADQAALALETALLRAAGPTRPWASSRLLGESPVMDALREDVERAARSFEPVLVLGEEGTGKSLVAREIHERSERAREPFLTLSTEHEDPARLERELFGHEDGPRQGGGLLTLAGKGTLFVHEVAALPLPLQSRLLHVLREGSLASGRRPRLACRLVAASREDLRRRVAAGTFSEPLYYQLDVLRIIVPPLRQRAGDVPLLLERFAAQAGGRRLRPSPNALSLLRAYAWPGNVRELGNEARRLSSLGDGRISSRQLAPEIQEGRGVTRAESNYAGKTLGEVERELIRIALETCEGNKARAARQLGIPRSTLYHLLERYGLA